MIRVAILVAVALPLGAVADDPLPEKARAVLQRQWERSRQCKSLFAEFTRTNHDTVFGSSTDNKGAIRYLHPGLGRLDVLPDAKGEGEEQWLYREMPSARHGKIADLWHHDPRRKQIVIHDIAPVTLGDYREGWALMGFLVGANQKWWQSRFQVEILRETQDWVQLKTTLRNRQSIIFPWAMINIKDDFL